MRHKEGTELQQAALMLPPWIHPQLGLHQKSCCKMPLPELLWGKDSIRTFTDMSDSALNTHMFNSLFSFWPPLLLLCISTDDDRKHQHVNQSVTDFFLLLKTHFVPSYLLAIHGEFTISWLILDHPFLNKLINFCIDFISLQDRVEN